MARLIAWLVHKHDRRGVLCASAKALIFRLPCPTALSNHDFSFERNTLLYCGIVPEIKGLRFVLSPQPPARGHVCGRIRCFSLIPRSTLFAHERPTPGQPLIFQETVAAEARATGSPFRATTPGVLVRPLLPDHLQRRFLYYATDDNDDARRPVHRLRQRRRRAIRRSGRPTPNLRASKQGGPRSRPRPGASNSVGTGRRACAQRQDARNPGPALAPLYPRRCRLVRVRERNQHQDICSRSFCFHRGSRVYVRQVGRLRTVVALTTKQYHGLDMLLLQVWTGPTFGWCNILSRNYGVHKKLT